MIYKKIFAVLVFAMTSVTVFCQVSKKDSVEKLSAATNAKDSATIIKDNNRAHATLNKNTGTEVPSTTSGTMNSTVNPSSQVIIPFGQKNKKSAAPVLPATPAPKD